MEWAALEIARYPMRSSSVILERMGTEQECSWLLVQRSFTTGARVLTLQFLFLQFSISQFSIFEFFEDLIFSWDNALGEPFENVPRDGPFVETAKIQKLIAAVG